MSRFNTGNNIGSLSEEDFYDNSMALDEAMNSTESTWRDRFGVEKPTIDAALKSAGFMPAGFDFVTGGTLQPGDRNKAVYNPAPNGDNNWYRWNGAFPKEIVANSQPNPKDENNWVPVGFGVDVIFVKNFGAVGDGIKDDTNAVDKAHRFANSQNLTVSYSGIPQLAIQADARIPVNTSVDFSGCRFKLLNGMVENVNWSEEMLTTFIVSDPNAPVENITGTTQGSLKRGSVTPFTGLIETPGVAVLKVPYKIPNRDGLGVVDYEQTFAIGGSGRTFFPLSADLTGFESQVEIKYRRNSFPITLKNISLLNEGFNNQKLLYIDRNNVSIDGFFVTEQNKHDPSIKTICSLLDLYMSGNTSITNLVSPSLTHGGEFEGTYVVRYQYVGNLYISRVSSVGEAGATGPALAGNHVNGLYFSECVTKRIDVHEGCHNLFVDNCHLIDSGVTYGWGGGEIRVTNCSFAWMAIPIESRVDYGGTFFGSITIDGFTKNYSDTIGFVALKIAAGANVKTYLPETIRVSNFRQIGVPKGYNHLPISIVITRNSKFTGRVVGPHNVIVDGIHSDAPSRLNVVIDYGSFEKPLNTYRQNVVIRDVVSGTTTHKKGDGLFLPPPSIVPNESCTVYVDVSDSDFILVDTSATNVVSRIDISNSGVMGVIVTPGSQSPSVSLSDCDLQIPAADYGAATPVGTLSNGTTKYTKLIGCTIWPGNFDLSGVAAASGCVFLKGTPDPLIPSGWTFNDFFIGKRSSFFK